MSTIQNPPARTGRIRLGSESRSGRYQLRPISREDFNDLLRLFAQHLHIYELGNNSANLEIDIEAPSREIVAFCQAHRFRMDIHCLTR